MKYFIYRILKNIIDGRRLSRLYLRRYLYSIELAKKEYEKSKKYTTSDNVWTMWLQEEIPEICKVCISSIKKYYPQAIVITEKNVNEYVEVPEYIWDKYKRGLIKPCHFSDYIRMCLLDRYGGVWIDATCLLTGYIPEFIQKSDFFILQDFQKSSISNYFIISLQNNYMTKVMRIFLEEYWKREDKAIHYFFFHHFLSLARKRDIILTDIWEKVPINLNLNTKLMRKVLYNDYKEEVYSWLSKTSYIHKLSYKNTEKYDINPKSLYRHLLNSCNHSTE